MYYCAQEGLPYGRQRAPSATPTTIDVNNANRTWFIEPRLYYFSIAVWSAKDAESTPMNSQKTTITILATLSAISLALADDFKTIDGKIYKDATISHVEADGIVIKTKTGIAKIYFVELPKDVQERFHYGSAPTAKAVTQRIEEAESAKHAAGSVDADGFAQQVATQLGESADRFAQKVATKLEERESILQGKQPKTRSRAELMARQEINFHWAFLAGTAIIASVLFAIVWARFK